MSDTQTAAEATPATEKAKVPQNPPRDAKWGRKRVRAEGRNKRNLKLKTDKEFAKAHFAAKSKRSTDKKSTFRKKKSKKK